MSQPRTRPLEVPIPQFSRPGVPRRTSASSVTTSTNDVTARPKPAREISSPRSNEKQQALGVPPNTSQARSGMATPAFGSDSPAGPDAGMTTLLAGQSSKSFIVHTDLLTTRSPYFREILSTSSRPSSHITSSSTNITTSITHHNTISYPDLDEFAFALFVRWLYGGQLTGPSDFHSMQHYISLYVLATKFQIEKLSNEVMDAVRSYYRSANMTAPPYRLEYIYNSTPGPNKMRQFLVTTAAYRGLCDGGLSDEMKDVLARGGDLAVDFIQAQVRLHGEGLGDARKGSDCAWHEHAETRACKRQVSEAWQE